MNVRSIFLTSCCVVSAALAAGQTYRIASGEWDALGSPHPVLRFLAAADAFGSNAIVDVEVEEPLAASVVNLDSVDHVLVIDDVNWGGVEIPAGDTVDFEWPALPMGTYRYHLDGERGSYLQASGVLRSGIEGQHEFVWHVADLEAALLDTVAAGGAWNAATYTPDFFTINEAHYPHTLDDPWALVSVALGDSAVISVANAGQMDHVFHFHGFHVEILQSTRSPERVGWIKDSVPVRRGEGLTLLLVPDQTGTYPVHDHNLIAVTNAGFYPGGMLTQIIVSP